jgi:hypothetical protein
MVPAVGNVDLFHSLRTEALLPSAEQADVEACLKHVVCYVQVTFRVAAK